MRDKIKSEDYFNQYLKYENKRISKFEITAEEVELSKGKEDAGLKSARDFIADFYLNKLYASFSVGSTEDELRTIFKETIDALKKSSLSRYWDSLSIASLGIMLDIDGSEMEELLLQLNNSNYKDDALLKAITSYAKGGKAVWTGNAIFPVPYAQLQPVFEEEYSIQVKTGLLKNYLERDWYEGNHNAAWYDSHKSKEDIYYGYWSFESGAIAKIYNLDTKVLEKCKYFPII